MLRVRVKKRFTKISKTFKTENSLIHKNVMFENT